MNTKQLFFFSLILLSIAMGVNWFKNRPKTVVKEPVQTRKAVDFNDKDFQETENKKNEEQDEEDDDEEEEDEEKIKLASVSKKYEGEVQDDVNNNENSQNKNEDDSDEDEDEDEDKDKNKKEKSNEIQKENNSVLNGKTDNNTGKTETASGASGNKQPDSDGFVLVDILKDDPIMQEYNQITKNPFELSPYAKLVEKIKKEQEMAAKPVVVEKKVVKVPKLMSNFRFTGTIETERGPKAIVDGSLYEKGNDLNGYTVKEIKKNVMFLVSGKDDFIVPKTGVQIEINPQTGEFSINDSYEN